MPIPPGGYSKQEFLSLHGYSEKTFKVLEKRKLAPRLTLFPNSPFSRVTEADYQDWLQLISQSKVQMEELLRRQARYEQIGRAAATSPKHVSKVWTRVKHRDEAAQKKKLQTAG
jgi:hypothetical protein